MWLAPSLCDTQTLLLWSRTSNPQHRPPRKPCPAPHFASLHFYHCSHLVIPVGAFQGHPRRPPQPLSLTQKKWGQSLSSGACYWEITLIMFRASRGLSRVVLQWRPLQASSSLRALISYHTLIPLCLIPTSIGPDSQSSSWCCFPSRICL